MATVSWSPTALTAYLDEGDSVVILGFSFGIASDSPDQVHEAEVRYVTSSP